MKCPICGKEVELQKKQTGTDENGEPVFVQYAICRDCKKRWKLSKHKEEKEPGKQTAEKQFEEKQTTEKASSEKQKEEKQSSGQPVSRAELKNGADEKEPTKEQQEQFPEEKKGEKRKKRKKGRVWKVLLIIFLVLVLLAGASAGVFFFMKETGKNKLQQTADMDVPMISDNDEEGLVYRDGKKYRYNENIISLLFMGIDTEEDLTEIKEGPGKSGQADSIFLMVLNPDAKKIRMIGISRDTMTEIRTFDYYGNDVGEGVNHLGLAYAFGNGGDSSGQLMMEAVSNLFYGLPIHGYCAVNLSAIPKVNDAVGGVTVVMPKGMELEGTFYPQGETVHLMGTAAERFVRQRDTDVSGSNNERMTRQKQYAVAFFAAAKAMLKKDITLPATLYSELSKEMVTSLTLDQVVYLATEVAGMSLNLDEIQMLAGTSRQGPVYDEFYVDEESLENLIIDVFYDEVE